MCLPSLLSADGRAVLPLALAVVVLTATPTRALSQIEEPLRVGAPRADTVDSDLQRRVTVVVMPFDFAAPLPAQHVGVGRPVGPPIWPLLIIPVLLLGGASMHSGGPALGAGAALTAAVMVPAMVAARPRPPRPWPPVAAVGPRGDDIGEAIGKGVADLLTGRLVNLPGFRVVERRRLDLLVAEQRIATGGDSLTPRDTAGARVTPGAILRARYIITGSITRFGTEEQRAGAGLGGRFGLGALGFKRPKTHVSLTARIIDATTGEIVASLTGAGTSTKGGSVLIAGGGNGGGGGVVLTSGEFRASALGEATERAIDALVEGIVAKRQQLE